ncbi:MAG: PRC-barrel domain containing protein [Halorientalis sp.]
MIEAFTPADEGKRVVTADGTVVGSVVRVEAGDAYVRPRPGLLLGCGSWISCPWDEDEPFALERAAVSTVRESEVVLERPSVPATPDA